MSGSDARDKISTDAGDHCEHEQRDCGNEEAKAFPEQRQVAAVPEDHADGNGERDQIKTGDENNVQQANAIEGEQRDTDESEEDRHDAATQRISEKCAAPKRDLSQHTKANCACANPAASPRQTDNVNPKRDDDHYPD